MRIRKGDDTLVLTSREKELVAIGAAIGSNCVPCAEYHLPIAKKAGLSDTQIREAILIADRVKKVPAEKVLKTALEFFIMGNNNLNENEKTCCAQQNRDIKNKSNCC